MHITSAPKHPQSNRAAEGAVKIIRHADQKPITEVDMYMHMSYRSENGLSPSRFTNT